MNNNNKINWSFEGIDYDTNVSLIAIKEGDTYTLASIITDECATEVAKDLVGFSFTKEEVLEMRPKTTEEYDSAQRQIGNFVMALSYFNEDFKFKFLSYKKRG